MLTSFSKLLKYRTHNLLAWRLLLYILLCSIFFTFLATIFQLYTDYRKDRELIEARIHQIQESYVPGLSESVWDFDNKLIETQLKGILQLPDIQYLEIQSKEGETLMTAGTPQTDTIISRQFPLKHEGKDRDAEIGTLYVVVTLKGVYQRLREKILVILSTQACTVFLLSICILLIFQSLVTRHLTAMARYTRNLDVHKLDTHLTLDRKASALPQLDELEQVVMAINAMQERMKMDIAKREGAEEALRESEERWQFALEGAGDGVWDWNAQTNRVFFSRQWKTMLGFEEYEIGDTLEEWDKRMHPEDRDYVYAEINKHFAGQSPMYVSEHRVQCKDGTYKWILDRGKVIRWTEDGKPLRVIGTHTDITERKWAEEVLQAREAFLDRVIEQSPFAIWISDTEGTLQRANTALKKFLNLTDEQLVGKYNVLNDPLVERQGLIPLIRTVYEEGKSISFTCDWDGNDIPTMDLQGSNSVSIEATMFPIYNSDSELTNVVLIWIDVTERKRAEEELQQYREHLEKLVKERTAELEQSRKAALNLMQDANEQRQRAEEAQKAAEAANRAKSEFLANMSHELRTPLNAILGFAQLMERDSALTAVQRDHLGIIRRSGEHLLKLINDVLDMSKIEAGQLTLHPQSFDLYRTLTNVEEMMRVRAEAKGLQFTVIRALDVPQYIKTDEVKLRQVLINLLSNAVEFTEQGEVILRVSNLHPPTSLKGGIASSADEQNSPLEGGRGVFSLLHFEISDTGIGIAPDEIETIFDTFRRTQYSETTKEGTGLGLAISHKFVRLMGGNITVKSEVGQGSVFTFDIQVEPGDMTEIEIVQPTRRIIGLDSNQPTYRILVVEDYLENRLLLTQLLQTVGFDVREATNGQEAIDLYKSWQPHLIWMDMRMSVMDGYEATKRIRDLERQKAKGKRQKEDTLRPSPIIALTASAFEEDRERILAAGCDDVVRKPLQEHEIFEMIHKYLEVRYVYEEGEGLKVKSERVKGKEVLMPEAFAALPGDVVANLEHATLDSDVKLINQVIHEIHNHNAALADALARLAYEFDYDTILKLIQEAK